MKKIFLALIRLYQKNSSDQPHCRFRPVCSIYAYKAIDKYGILRGGLLSIKRIFKCHPFHSGGYDPLK